MAGGMSWWQAVGTVAARQHHRARPDDADSDMPARSTAFRFRFSPAPRSALRGSTCPRAAARRWSPAAGSASRPGSAARRSIPCSGSRCTSWNGLPAHIWVSFALFWAMNIYFIVKGTESIRFFEAWAAPVLLLMGLALLGWAISQGRAASVQSSRSHANSQTSGEFFAFFVPSLTAMVGFWATLSINIPDFTRYATSSARRSSARHSGCHRRWRCFRSSASRWHLHSVLIFGEAIWDPVVLLGKFGNPVHRAALGVCAGGCDPHDQHRGERRVRRPTPSPTCGREASRLRPAA